MAVRVDKSKGLENASSNLKGISLNCYRWANYRYPTFYGAVDRGEVNTIALVPAIRNKPDFEGEHYLEIEIDGKPLAHHFAGQLGAHPSHISPFGWSKSPGKLMGYDREQLLGNQTLESGRVPVLACELCGTVGCGAFTVRILMEGHLVRWTDWAYETGFEDLDGAGTAGPPEWPTKPGDFLFDRELYEGVLREYLQPPRFSWFSRLMRKR